MTRTDVSFLRKPQSRLLWLCYGVSVEQAGTRDTFWSSAFAAVTIKSLSQPVRSAVLSCRPKGRLLPRFKWFRCPKPARYQKEPKAPGS